MFYIKVLIFAMVFCKFVQNLRSCPKGKRVKAGGCAPCQDNYFQDEENDHTSCKVCTNCETKSGSYVFKACTSETNTVCKCQGNFVARDTVDFSTCKCNPGYGLKYNGNENDCLKCEDGYFSTMRDSPCKKWRQCGFAGVKVNGTDTSDVVCNEELNGAARLVTTDSTPKEDVASISPVTPYTSPHEGNQSHKMLTTTREGNVIIQTTNRGYYIGVFITFTLVGLLVLIVLTLKVFSTPHPERDCEESKHESLCEPVMEIGDKSCASIKLNPGDL